MKRRPFLLAVVLALAACATTPPSTIGYAGRDAGRDFAIEARFSLRMERFGESPQQGSGRLSWAHQNGSDRVLLAGPLGTGLAEIDIAPRRARLRTANGELREAADADALVREVTGYELPVSRLAGWLLGRPGEGGQLLTDDRARPLRLREAGWQIDYTYADAAPDALPYRLDVSRASEVSLILRIEEWRAAP